MIRLIAYLKYDTKAEAVTNKKIKYAVSISRHYSVYSYLPWIAPWLGLGEVLGLRSFENRKLP